MRGDRGVRVVAQAELILSELPSSASVACRRTLGEGGRGVGRENIVQGVVTYRIDVGPQVNHLPNRKCEK